jgi:predicted anti-sigma-YlaC factor YlaD
MSRLQSFWRILTLHCNGAAELTSRRMDEVLPASDKVALAMHVAICKSCRGFQQQLHVMRDALQRMADHSAEEFQTATLSDTAKGRIVKAMRDV